MSKEAAMILLDNSDWSRNGDQHPTRWEAQNEAAQMIANNKLNIDIENTVGALLMAGKQVEVLLTPCNDITKFLGVLHGVQLRGQINLKNSISIASLALKHRQNKNLKQRLFVFVASPVKEDEKTLVDLGKKLKKNNIAVDMVNIGIMDSEHISKLQKFIETVNNQGNSHFQNIEPSVQLLSDQLLGTAIISEAIPQELQGMQAEGQGAAQNNFQGVDPNQDPELAMVLRISLEEERERLKKQNQENNQQQPQAQQPQSQSQEQVPQQVTQAQQNQNQNSMEDEKKSNEPSQQQQPVNQQQAMEEELDEEELMRRATELSLKDDKQDQSNKIEAEKKQKEQEVLQDPEFVEGLLKSIAGLDADKLDIKNILDKNQNQKKDDSENKDKQDKSNQNQ